MSIRFCKNCGCNKLVSFGDIWACPRCGSVETDWDDGTSTISAPLLNSSMGGKKE
jgi:RNA polymerase subunit RPABC4/transcription elongation factor Spt4